MDSEFTVTVFNADRSNRHEELQHRSKKESTKRLSGSLFKKIQEYSTRVISDSPEVEPASPRAGVSAQEASNDQAYEEMFADFESFTLSPKNVTSENPLPTSPSADSSATDIATQSSGASNIPDDDEIIGGVAPLTQNPKNGNHLEATYENRLPTSPSAASSATDIATQSSGASNIPDDDEIIGGVAPLTQSPKNGNHLEATYENRLPTSPSADSSVNDTPPQSSSSSTSLPAFLLTISQINGLVTVSEFNKAAYKELLKRLNEGQKYEGILTKKKNDQLATYWNVDIWQRIPDPDIDELRDKRYNAVILEHKITKKRLLYISVHLSHNASKDYEKQKAELQEIKKLIEDNKQKEGVSADAWIIAGDFNMIPSEIKRVFGSDMTPAISSDYIKTTRGRKSFDNILMSDAIELQSPVTIDTQYRLGHFPLYGVLRFKDK